MFPDAALGLTSATVQNFRAVPARDQETEATPAFLYRSGNLDRVSPQELQALKALGISDVIDLRAEQEKRPGRPALDGMSLHDLAIKPMVGHFIREMYPGQDVTAEIARAAMQETYLQLGVNAAVSLGRILDVLTAPAATGVLIHCSAGKDRTGFIVACLLRWLGVSQEAILADYLASNTGWTVPADESPDVQGEPRAIVGSVAHEYLERSWVGLDTHFGGFNAFMERFLPADNHRQDLLRRRLRRSAS